MSSRLWNWLMEQCKPSPDWDQIIDRAITRRNTKAREESVVNKDDNSDKTVPNLECNGDNSDWIDKEEFDFLTKAIEEAVPNPYARDTYPRSVINNLTKTISAKDISDSDGNLWVDEVAGENYVPGTDVIVSFDTTDSSSEVTYDSCND